MLAPEKQPEGRPEKQPDRCAECGDILIGDEKHFCTDCYQELTTPEVDENSPFPEDFVHEDEVQDFLTAVNTDMNAAIAALREMQITLKGFAQKHECLGYISFKSDKRFQKESSAKEGGAKESSEGGKGKGNG